MGAPVPVPAPRSSSTLTPRSRDNHRRGSVVISVVTPLVDTRYRLVLQGRVGAQLEHEAPREADVARHAGPDRARGHAAVKAWMLCAVRAGLLVPRNLNLGHRGEFRAEGHTNSYEVNRRP